MIYEIVNPSDACTVECDSEAAACVAVMYLGEGSYGITDENGESPLPFFRFGGDPEKWFLDTYGEDINTFVEKKLADIADCLDSILYGGLASRRDHNAILNAIDDPGEREKVLAVVVAKQDDKRSSMTNIYARAKELAKRIREKSSTTGEKSETPE